MKNLNQFFELNQKSLFEAEKELSGVKLWIEMVKTFFKHKDIPNRTATLEVLNKVLNDLNDAEEGLKLLFKFMLVLPYDEGEKSIEE